VVGAREGVEVMALAYHDEAKMGNRDAQVEGASLIAKALVAAREGVEVMALAYHDVLVEVKADDEPVVAKRVARHDE